MRAVANGSISSVQNGNAAFDPLLDALNSGGLVSVVWEFDTLAPVEDISVTPGFSNYQGTADWITASVQIDPGGDYEDIHFGDSWGLPDGTLVHSDYVSIEDTNHSYSIGSVNRVGQHTWSNYLSITGMAPYVIDTVGLHQALMWELGDNGSATGQLTYFIGGSFARINYNVREFSVSAVPLPPALYFFATGLLGLYGLAVKRRRSAPASA